jgi:hypothetical protein
MALILQVILKTAKYSYRLITTDPNGDLQNVSGPKRFRSASSRIGTDRVEGLRNGVVRMRRLLRHLHELMHHPHGTLRQVLTTLFHQFLKHEDKLNYYKLNFLWSRVVSGTEK